MSPVTDDVIRAAGALLWRRTSKGYEIAVIHRRRYDDWTLPKGKLQDGESWRQAALREVSEETGFDAVVLDFAGAIVYRPNDKQKVVRFWHMLAKGEPAVHIDEEVAQVFWVSPEDAHDQLQYPLERALVDVWQGPGKETRMTNSQSSSLLRWLQFLKSRCLKLFRSMSLERLGHSIRTFEPELEFLIQQQQDKPSWVDCSRGLLKTAKAALADRNPELGWRCLKAAERFSFYGMEADELEIAARLIQTEATDDEKGVLKWRRKAFEDLLVEKGSGNLKKPVKVTDVVRAKRILDDHQDNVYHKLAILRSRLRPLSIISGVTLAVWLILVPLSPCVTSVFTAAGPDATCLPPRQLWFAIMLAGVLGAIVSGFSSSIGRDQKKSRIPEEVSASMITFARFSLAMVSAVAVSIFLLSGILNLSKPPPSFELLLAAGFVSGFSERLLMRAIETLSK
jgi:8-oxo-dGTP pyrophosphatase MutT (NUDIX family)